MWVELQRLILRFWRKKVPEVSGTFFCALWAFFEGVLENADGKRGVFCGEVVVKCVANAVRKRRFSADSKMGQGCEYFYGNFFQRAQ
jgi:hypothetical protein